MQCAPAPAHHTVQVLGATEEELAVLHTTPTGLASLAKAGACGKLKRRKDVLVKRC